MLTKFFAIAASIGGGFAIYNLWHGPRQLDLAFATLCIVISVITVLQDAFRCRP